MSLQMKIRPEGGRKRKSKHGVIIALNAELLATTLGGLESICYGIGINLLQNLMYQPIMPLLQILPSYPTRYIIVTTYYMSDE